MMPWALARYVQRVAAWPRRWYRGEAATTRTGLPESISTGYVITCARVARALSPRRARFHRWCAAVLQRRCGARIVSMVAAWNIRKFSCYQWYIV